MDFRLLGPLEVSNGRDVVPIGQGRQRSVLTLLLLHHDETLGADRIIDALWGDHPPPTAGKVLQNQIGQLRRALGDRGASMLRTHGHGYALHLEGAGIDVERFEELARAGAAALDRDEPAEARARLAEALAVWRGPALADAAYEEFAQREIGRLEEERLTALEQRLDAELALGLDDELLPELEVLVAEHPTHERLRAQLMLALYRCGRQADALQAYREGRGELIGELGVEPGPRLRELEAAILRQDPGLTPSASRWGRRPAAPDRRRTAAVLLICGGVALIAVAAAAILMLAGAGTGRTRLALLDSGRLGAVDPSTGHVLGSLALRGAPAVLATDGDRLWAADRESATVTAIDVRRRLPGEVLAPGGTLGGLASDAAALWTIDAGQGRLLELRPGYPGVARRARLPPVPSSAVSPPTGGMPHAIDAGGGAVWVTDGSSRVSRFDQRTGALRRIDVGRPVNDVAVGEDAVWLASGPTAAIVRLDPRGIMPPEHVPIAGRRGITSPYPIAIATGLGAVWVLNATTATVTRVDPEQLAPVDTTQIGVERHPRELAVGAGAVWVADGDGTLARLSPTGGPPRILRVAHGIADVAIAGGLVWVTSTQGPGALAMPASGGATGVRPLDTSHCSPVYEQPGTAPRLLLAADLPLAGPNADLGLEMTEAIRQALVEHRFAAGRHAVAFQACDDSVADPRLLGLGRCRANARMYARNPSAVAVIGPLGSGCARAILPVLNTSRPPLPEVGAANTYAGLTARAPGTARGEPDRYRAGGVRSYVRVVPTDPVQGAADALIARRIGTRRAFVVREPSRRGIALAAAFRRTARRVGVRVAGTAGASRARLVLRRTRTLRADTVYLAGALEPARVALIMALRRSAGDRVRLVGSGGFATDEAIRLLGPAADGMYVSLPGVAVERLPARGRRFAERLARTLGGPPAPSAIYAAQATEVLLDAIGRSDGTRESVRRRLFETRVHDGLVGAFAITPAGDSTDRSISAYRVAGGRLRPLVVVRPAAGRSPVR